MPNQKKKDTVVSLKKDIDAFDAIALTDFVGVTHQQLEELRRQLRDNNGKIRVIKNALLLLALKDAGIKVDDLTIEGPTAVILAGGDNLTPFKTVYDKGQELETFKIKGGVWENEVVSADHIVRLSTLPGIDTLRAQLVGNLQSPISKLVFGLKGNLNKLVIALEQVRIQKEGQNTSS